jgi:hypothetical protein
MMIDENENEYVAINEDEDDEIREYRDEVIRQIDDDDPSLSEICISSEADDLHVMPNDGEWKEFGASLGRNTNITDVTIQINDIQRGVQVVYFFQGFAMNRSIEKLDVHDVVESSDMFPLLVPFFMNNNSLKTLRVSCKEGGDECLSKIAFALGQFNSLTDFLFLVVLLITREVHRAGLLRHW